ncbi:MAG: alpha/beta hydrolase [Spirochaetes bacterium]|nr:alpha/beta hydrolase [Spirochaetota bacterium]
MTNFKTISKYTLFLLLALSVSIVGCSSDKSPQTANDSNKETNPILENFSERDIVTVTYKTTVSPELKADIFVPQNFNAEKEMPVLITFHGGAWTHGMPSYMHNQCWIFSSKGFIAVAPWYRVKNSHETTPIESIQDAKSIIRWIRKNAAELHADPDRIVVSGASAGGHLAAACAMIEEFNDTNDDLGVSCIPNALILYCPALDADNSYFRSLMKKSADTLKASPYHNIRKNLPPTLIFHGNIDKTVPYNQSVKFTQRMKEYGNTCVLSTMEGHEHIMQDQDYANTKDISFDFLKKIGIIR